MTIKEQENKIILNFKVLISLLIFVWLVLAGMAGYRLWSLQIAPKLSPAPINQVPTIKEENIDILRSSIKSLRVNNLPLVRPEPFD